MKLALLRPATRPLSVAAFALVTALSASVASAAEPPAAPKTKAAPANPSSAPRHAIKGVVTGHYAERQSLIIRHEEIPGVMRAMTMAFKVDEATFKAAKQGDHIVGQMSREPEGWRLHDVKLSPPPPTSK